MLLICLFNSLLVYFPLRRYEWFFRWLSPDRRKGWKGLF